MSRAISPVMVEIGNESAIKHFSAKIDNLIFNQHAFAYNLNFVAVCFVFVFAYLHRKGKCHKTFFGHNRWPDPQPPGRVAA